VVVVAMPAVTLPTFVEGNIVLVPVAAPIVSNPIGGSEAVAIFPAAGPIALVADSSIAASPPRLIFAFDKVAVTEVSVSAKFASSNVAT
jgi:hypothetical protein